MYKLKGIIRIPLQALVAISCDTYPLARNQHINNSPRNVSCIRAGANAGATCIRTEMNSLRNLAILRKMIPQNYFPVFARVQIQPPHVFTQELIPQEFFLHVLVLRRGVPFLAQHLQNSDGALHRLDRQLLHNPIDKGLDYCEQNNTQHLLSKEVLEGHPRTGRGSLRRFASQWGSYRDLSAGAFPGSRRFVSVCPCNDPMLRSCFEGDVLDCRYLCRTLPTQLCYPYAWIKGPVAELFLHDPKNTMA